MAIVLSSRDLEAFGDLLHPAQRRQRLFDRLRIEPAGLAEILAQPGRFLLLIQNAIVPPAQRLGHDQPHAVGADVDRRQPIGQLGREEVLLFFHVRVVSAEPRGQVKDRIQQDTHTASPAGRAADGVRSRLAG